MNSTWGNLENALEQLDSLADTNDTVIGLQTTRPHCENYDLQANLQCPQQSNMGKSIHLRFQVTKHPFFLENEEYYKIKRLLNKEQQAIVKDIAWKKCKDIHTHVHLFLI
jgi:hypothetical protein